MSKRIRVLVLASLVATVPAAAKHRHHGDEKHRRHDDARGPEGSPGLADVTLLVVRHAEKPSAEGDADLSPAGAARTEAYATYFRHFALDGKPIHLEALIASSDSKESARPRLTLEPLATVPLSKRSVSPSPFHDGGGVLEGW